MHEEWVDRWKGLLIALVVLGHSVGVASHFAHGMTMELFDYLYKVIYCFHMPAFFCLMGYVWRVKEDEGFGIFCRKKFMRLIVPYLFFAVWGTIIYYAASGAFRGAVQGAADAYYANMDAAPTIPGMLLSIVHAGGWPSNGVFRANSVLWFLPAMFAVCVIYRFVDAKIRSARWQILLSCAFLVGSFYMPRNLPWGLSKVLYYLPFVIVGRWILPKLMSKCLMGSGLGVLIGCIYFFVCWITPDSNRLNTHLTWRIGFFMIAVMGSVFSAAVVKNINNVTLAHFGCMSMGIMLIHKYIILALGMKIQFVRSLYSNVLPVAFLVVVVVSVCSLLVSCWMSKLIERYYPEILGGRRK